MTARKIRYVERNKTLHESLVPPVTSLHSEELQAWLREMLSFSRIVCFNWPPHMELAAQNEAIAHARKEGWI